MRYIVTGGGTGGHVYPAIAIKEIIQNVDPDAEFLYIGVKGKAEEHIINALSPENAINIKFIKASGLPRSLSPIKFGMFKLNLFLGTIAAFKILRGFNADVVVATGGYVSAPVLIAGALLRKKQFIHEQNSVPGLVNKFLAKLADRIFITFSETSRFFPEGKTVTVGYPVRNAIKKTDKSVAQNKLHVMPGAKVLFIFGGSSGAKPINEAVCHNLKTLLSKENLVIYHGCGRDRDEGYSGHANTIELIKEVYPDALENKKYVLKDYFYNIDEIYAAADLIVCRAGAGTIMECAALGKAVALIPKAGLPGDHQEKNAQAVAKIGGAKIINENISDSGTSINNDEFINTIFQLIDDEEARGHLENNIKKMFVETTREVIAHEIRTQINN